MISVEQALSLVLQHTLSLSCEHVPLLQSLHRVLALEIKADRNFPPFDRVTMDGIAIDAAEFEKGTRTFPIAHVQAAGEPHTTLSHTSNCVEVMTGAMLPVNTNAVIPYEDCQIKGNLVTVVKTQVSNGQNIHRQGSDCVKGTILLTAGQQITPAMIGTLASVGCATVPVYRLPKVAVCSTGNELVDLEETPLPHQIRKSNAYMLAAALQQENISANVFHLPDEPTTMRQQLISILEDHEVLLLSGAVSKGKFDYLPQVLEKLHFRVVFHKIAQKPGKPMLFGQMPRGQVIFGFPGNPVSTFVCYHLYFKPWLNSCLGLPMQQHWARLTHDVSFKPALTYHLSVALSNQDGTLQATAVPTTGSGDLTSILKADGFLSLPAGREHFLSGESFPVTFF